MPLFFLCLLFRFALALLLFHTDARVSSIICSTIGLGLLYLYVTRQRLHAVESSTGCTWWHSVRPVHALLWLVSAVYFANNKPGYAVSYLMLDTLVGWMAYVNMRGICHFK